MIKEAKAETPRKIELVCLKNRYGVANFSNLFNYYPANDLFTEADPAGWTAAAPETTTAFGKAQRI